MTCISADAPTVRASTDNMKNFLSFVYMNEPLLKQYGAIKIAVPTEFQSAKKKNRIKLMTPSMTQQVMRLNQNDFIYSVDSVPCFNEKEQHQPSHLDEAGFWSSLSHFNYPQKISSVSKIPGASFFLKRVRRTDLDIHQLPRRSLLRLCDKNILRQFVPSLIRTHGPGAISPLASGRQRLLSFNYHHEGGVRYWYIVPANERNALERLFHHQKTSACLEHGCILMDPLMFDKYKIRYHRLIQQPNEIIIIGAGALSQSFTDDASWSETIDFALPSWLDDGHAQAQITCDCQLDKTSKSEIIDTKLFSRGIIQRYISSNLNYLTEETSSSYTDKPNLAMSDTALFSNISSGSFDLSSNQVADSCMWNSALEIEDIDDDRHLKLLKTAEEVSLHIASNGSSSSISSSSSDITAPHIYSTSFGSINDFYALSPPKDFYEDIMEASTSEPRCLSLQEIIDLLATPPSTITSTQCQTEELINDHTNVMSSLSSLHSSTTVKSIENSKAFKNKRTKKNRNSYKTLVIHNMRNNVTSGDIRRHFVGCTKDTIKRSYMSSHLNYAFVLHRKRRDAEYNLRRPINSHVFGSNCYVEFMKEDFQLSRIYRNADVWNVMVKGVPIDVTETDLRNLFIGCHSMKFIPARIVDQRRPHLAPRTKHKVLYGYAFLYYTSIEEAVNVVKNADKFQISNQPLTVTFYDAMKSSWAQKKMAYLSQSVKHSHITLMGQEESGLMVPGAGNPPASLPSDWRYTIQTVVMERRLVPVNKDQYKFHAELGAGAFGSVYSARRISDHKPVAIKVVSLVTWSSADGEMLAESILTEIEMSKRLSRASNHVVRMFDFDFHRQSGLAFLVMELGQHDLEKRLKTQPRLSNAERKIIWRQLVSIAMVLHDNNIVHLDIKPQNLIVFPGNRIKLGDLGIAQKAYRHRVGSNGTWLYSAPEVTMAPRHHVAVNTSKSDVWSWGAVLYRMTYQEPPEYTPPCYRPPKNQHTYRDPQLVDVLRHTLVRDIRERADPPWLTRHPYTGTP
ncbi:unnamed protein product [Rotaria socialis]|uniref:Protein kinase domain-containing protein n=3 Tax=Rotaria socialis TaxID=392032 RepID=A0A818FCK0_9BILA|nr:unnamed protein product [Rotaria socialis]